MNIAITGSEGFIGTHLKRKLVAHNLYLIDLKRGIDIRRKLDYFRPFDVVIHLAAVIDVQQCELDPYLTHSINVEGTRNIFYKSLQNKVKRFIFMSSAEARNPDNHYGRSKSRAERLCEEYKDKIELVVLRPFNVYGPNQEKNLIGNLMRARRENTFLNINGDGTHTRDFVHVFDVCNTINASLESICGTFEVGTGTSSSVRDVVEAYREMYNGPEYKYVKGVKETEHSVADPTKFLPNWKPKYTLINGLKTLHEQSNKE